MVITSASQAEEGGSIPLTRSNERGRPALFERGRPAQIAEIAQLVEQHTRNV